MKPLKDFIKTEDSASYVCATLERVINHKQEQLKIIRAAIQTENDAEMKDLESKFKDLYIINDIAGLKIEIIRCSINRKYICNCMRGILRSIILHSRYNSNIEDYNNLDGYNKRILSRMKELIEGHKLYEDEDLLRSIIQKFCIWIKSALEDTSTSLQKALNEDCIVSDNLKKLKNALDKL